jgi:hypothetical protein
MQTGSTPAFECFRKDISTDQRRRNVLSAVERVEIAWFGEQSSREPIDNARRRSVDPV